MNRDRLTRLALFVPLVVCAAPGRATWSQDPPPEQGDGAGKGAGGAEVGVASVEDLEKALGWGGSDPVGLPEIRERLAKDAVVAGRAVALLDCQIAPAPLARLAAALYGTRLPPDVLPALLKVARGPIPVERRRLAVLALAMHVEREEVFGVLRALSLAAAEDTSVRVAAVESLRTVQQFLVAAKGLNVGAHIAHLKALASSDAPSAVRAAASRGLFGVGERPSDGGGSEEDVDFLLAVAEKDRDPVVRIAAIQALPPRWRGVTALDPAIRARVATLAHDASQPALVRLAAAFFSVWVRSEDEGMVEIARAARAAGADMTCWRCDRLLSAEDGCKRCEWLKSPPKRLPSRQ